MGVEQDLLDSLCADLRLVSKSQLGAILTGRIRRLPTRGVRQARGLNWRCGESTVVRKIYR
jgi:hypothetical protein